MFDARQKPEKEGFLSRMGGGAVNRLQAHCLEQVTDFCECRAPLPKGLFHALLADAFSARSSPAKVLLQAKPASHPHEVGG